MKLSDYIISYLASLGTKHVFVLTGGACAYIIDSFHKFKDKIEYVCVQHEQAAAMAADAYSRFGAGLGATVVTSGPGATNLITGICCSWFDSIPAIHISGQVNTNELSGNNPVRQTGFQETDIVNIVKPITKYAVMVTNPEKIRYELEKAVYLATSGRPGPVLIDIPMDVQRAEIEPEQLESFTISETLNYHDTGEKLQEKVEKCVSMIKNSKRPVILLGGGIRLSNSVEQTRDLVETLQIPVVSNWAAIDIIPYNHKLYVGQFGVYGNRGANLVISLGSRLDSRQTGGNIHSFAREAKRIAVDIDNGQLSSARVQIDLPINTDLKEFFLILKENLSKIKLPSFLDWIQKSKELKERYPACLPEFEKQTNDVNPYYFMKVLSKKTKENEVICTDCGGNLVWTIQGAMLKNGQRIFSALGNSPMGYSLPASIGASIALNKKQVICIIGDGGLQINLQEFQTIVKYKLPIKVFIFNNHGYGIIKQFQDMYLNGRHEATGNGYSCPDFIKIASSYGIKSETIRNHSELEEKLERILNDREAVICDVILNDQQTLIPKLEWQKPIEDLTPYLNRKEFRDNMIIKPLE